MGSLPSVPIILLHRIITRDQIQTIYTGSSRISLNELSSGRDKSGPYELRSNIGILRSMCPFLIVTRSLRCSEMQMVPHNLIEK